jgi:hypothetical protein
MKKKSKKISKRPKKIAKKKNKGKKPAKRVGGGVGVPEKDIDAFGPLNTEAANDTPDPDL